MATATPGFATQAEIQAALKRQGATAQQASVLSAIAYAESSGYTAANNNYQGHSYQGLFQIGEFWGTNQAKIHSDDLDYQAGFAMKVLHQQGLGAWETYTNGMFQKYLNQNTPSSPALSTKSDLADFADITGQGAGAAAAGAAAATPLLAARSNPIDGPTSAGPTSGQNPTDAPGVTGSPIDAPGTETAFGNPIDGPHGFDKSLSPSGA